MDETLKTIHSLRSIHGNFSDRRISDDDLETILGAAVRAANAGNMQTYSIIVVDDRAVMKELCMYVGSVALVFCVDHSRVVDTANHLGHNFSPKTVGWFITGSTDAILSAQTACIAARSLGIDSLFTSSLFRGDFTRVHRLLDIPEKYCFPLITLVLGYPKREPKHRKGRLYSTGIIHRGKHRRMTAGRLEEIVNEYDDPERHMTIPAIGGWRKRGFKHYLDLIFTWWGAGDEDEDSRQLFAALMKTGFFDGEKLNG
jgi:nitroreductase